GRTSMLLDTAVPTAARHPGEVDDWTNYYVDIFVDRDMFMRYLGGGIGHTYTSQTEFMTENDSSDGIGNEDCGADTSLQHRDIDPNSALPELEQEDDEDEGDDEEDGHDSDDSLNLGRDSDDDDDDDGDGDDDAGYGSP
ncbi:hypothetical protein V5O48_019538, partial [Marasmius crinis-equi]